MQFKPALSIRTFQNYTTGSFRSLKAFNYDPSHSKQFDGLSWGRLDQVHWETTEF